MNPTQSGGWVTGPGGVWRPAAHYAEGGAVPRGEVATTRDGRDITRGYVEGLPLLPPQDYLLLGQAGGDYQVYEKIQSDPQVQTGLTQRKKALVAREWEVLPGQRRGQYSKARARQAAESLRAMLEDLGGEVDTEDGEQAQPLPGWDAVSECMLHGIFPGFGVAECLWQRDGREVVLDRVQVRKARRFAFAPSGALRLLTTAHPLGEPLPRRKFWTYTANNDSTDDPYGLGLAHWLYWPVYFKRADIRLWLLFLEKFGMPTVVGEYPVGTPDAERAKLLEATRAIRADSGLIIPQGMVLNLLEAARGGTADYAAVHAIMDAAISKVLVGHSAAADSTPGRLGGEDRSKDVATAITKADADLVCGSFNVGPARWLTDWNFGDVPAPKVWRRVEDEQDLKPLAERDRIIMDLAAGLGQRLTVAYLTTTYGVELEPLPPVAPVVAQDGGGDASEDEGEGADEPADETPDAADHREAVPAATPDWAETQVAALGRAAAPVLDDWLARVRRDLDAYISAGRTPADFAAHLLTLYPALPGDDLANIMGEALAAADLAGRYAVTVEDAGAPGHD
ncbi:MAG: DUF935 family protein [Chromatiaceae bacterium]|nr:DUF935 family protein [Chromatiaceae bacterium]